MTKHPRRTRIVNLVPLIAAAVVALAAGNAQAQMGGNVELGSPGVTVDLSVIDDGGYGPPGRPAPATMAPRAPVGRLMMPGLEPPASKLYVPVPPAAASPRAAGERAPALRSERLAPAAPALQPPAPSPRAAERAPSPNTEAAPSRRAEARPQPPAPVPSPPKGEAAPPLPSGARPQVASPAPPPPSRETTTPPVASATLPPPPPPPSAAAPERKAAGPATQAPTAAEQASRPPGGGEPGVGKTLKLAFDDEESKITPEGQNQLKNLAARLKDLPEARLQLMAYAGGESVAASKARRLSLSRALAVRSFLIENGVRSTRIDVRALGNKATGDAINRVDVVVTER